MIRPLLAASAFALVGCVGRGAPPSPAAEDAAAPPSPVRVAALAALENRRAIDEIGEADLGHHDVGVRRAAARALARIADPRGNPMLTRALSDEDPEVVAWAAYGLGYSCRWEGIDAQAVVRAIVARAFSVPDQGKAPLDPHFAMARALGRCATDEAERTLVAWLGGTPRRASDAALGLGDLASRRKALTEATQVALLAAAAGSASAPPLPEALFPFGRLDRASPTVVDRLLEVSRARLATPGSARVFAVRALGRTDGQAAGELVRILTSAGAFDPAERTEAARALTRLGDAGQRALGDALVALAPSKDPVALTALGTDAIGPLVATLESLEKVPKVARVTLYDLANLPPPPSAPVTIARRVARLRCAAAALLVNGGVDDPLLVRCDPEPDGATGQRARLDVLGRRPIEAARLATWKKLAASKSLRVREAAIELLAGHPEIAATTELAAALGAKEPGMVATAAQVLAMHPDRAAGAAPPAKRAAVAPEAAPSDAIAHALADALARAWAPDDVEPLSTVVDAAAAVHLASATAKLEQLCTDPNPTLRDHVSRALTSIKGAKVVCAPPPPPPGIAPELSHLAASAVEIVFETDGASASLVLDPSLAPVAVTRIRDLAKAGFYDGIVLHRVVPGFVVQLGDPGADGFGGPGQAPLRCETSPTPFEPLSVGVALAGRDTGASQIFVTLARFPHLDGEYAWLGRAKGDWAALVEGDVVRKVKLVGP